MVSSMLAVFNVGNVVVMGGRRYPVKDVIVETPRYPGGGAMGMSAGPEHDLLGHGWIEIEDGTLIVAIQRDGVVGRLEPKEKRRYNLADIRGWRVAGTHLEFSVGSIGGFATDGAEAPVHQGQAQLSSTEDAASLTTEAQVGGMRPPSQPPRHSGI